jgi:plastocyanin
MRFQLRKRVAVAALAAAASIPALIIGGGSAFAQGDGSTINAKVGAGETGYSVNAFLPENLTVKTGTTVNWSFTWPEPHMIVLDNGLTPEDIANEPPADTSPFDFDGVRKYVYSGVIFGDPANPPTFAIKFEKAGDYHITCFIHPGMDGSVTVVDSGDVDTQETADARASDEYNTDISALKAAANAANAAPTKVTGQADGSSLYEVDMLPPMNGSNGMRDYIQQYFPASVDIHEGDSVKWNNPTSDAHTVTFNVENSGIDFNTTDPFEVPPAVPANNTYDGGSEFVHSGIIGVAPDEGAQSPPASFTLKFTKAGTYNYICVLHVSQGMTGTVKVEAQMTPSKTATASPSATATKTTTTAPAPPNTGSGTGNSNRDAYLLVAVAAVLFIATGTGVTAVALRRRDDD